MLLELEAAEEVPAGRGKRELVTGQDGGRVRLRSRVGEARVPGALTAQESFLIFG